MPLMQLPAKQCSLKTYLETFVLVAESLCNSQEGDIIVQGTNILWANEDGDCAYKMLIEFQNSSEMIGDMDTDSIQKHLERYMTRIAVRPTFGSHPRLFIWGTPEARLQQCDVLILGGLNEESFPIMPDCCIWLSRAMRDKIGLSRPERRIGLAAHDFVQAACAKNVFLTRSLRANGKPQIAARWLFRLESLITGAFGKEAYEDLKNTPYLHYVKLLDMPENSKSYIATPPMPTPPTQMRPRKLPITEIGTWVRDPYAIYAKHILGLKKLDPIDASVEARDKGTKIHYLLEVFLKEFKDTLPISAKTRLNELTLQLREEMRQDPLLYSIWGGRLNIIKDYYFQWEQKHRKAGNKPYLIEQEASLNFDIKMDNGEIRQFTLTGKADRIDKDPFGNAIIIDYKTGNPPTYKEVAAGFEPQLPLEAILLKEGGFGGDYKIDTNQLIYIHLKGTQKEQGKIIYIEPSKKDNYENLRDLIQGTRDNFINWIKKFEDSKQPYFSRIRVKNENIHYDYDHLARVLEWGGGSNDE
jgi:ATP-dependent helicase/nuclease subunit B